jgi:hypothetical protein
MSQLDRLGWAAGLTISTFGRHVGFRANDPGVLPPLFRYLPPGWKEDDAVIVERLYTVMTGSITGGESGTTPLFMIYQDTDIIAATDSIEMAGAFLEADLQLYIAETARNRVFVHAGVVGWKGKAILLPGPVPSGTTSLVVELVKAGATYYSDEFAVLDSKGRVHPYPKPLTIRGNLEGKPHKLSIEELGGRSARKPLPVGLVIITRYKEGARWRPRRLSPGQGVLELLAHTVPARSEPEMAMSVLREVTSHAPLLKTRHGEAEDTVNLILSALERNTSVN